MLIDSPYFPDELDALPALLGQAGLRASTRCSPPTRTSTTCSAGRRSPRSRSGWPSRRCCGSAPSRAPPSASCATSTPSTTSSARRRSSLGQIAVAAGARQARARRRRSSSSIPAEGHTADGMAVFAPWCGVLACGDYLSSVEIPSISAGAARSSDYRATLGTSGAARRGAPRPWCPATARRSRATRRPAAARRGPRLPRRAWQGGEEGRGCRMGATRARQREVHAAEPARAIGYAASRPPVSGSRSRAGRPCGAGSLTRRKSRAEKPIPAKITKPSAPKSATASTAPPATAPIM